MKFSDFHLQPSLLKALDILKFNTVKPVQEKVIPCLLDQKDCIVLSNTGSGKTAAYLIPILETIDIQERSPQALILTPTRELALQVQKEAQNLGTFQKIKALPVFGKQPFAFQKEDLKQRTHLVCGTPGRVLDHLKQGTLPIEKIKTIVIDEADEMLNMNFMDEVEAILSFFKKKHTTALFSATMPKRIETLAMTFLKNPEKIEIMSETIDLQEIFYRVQEPQKLDALCTLMEKEVLDSYLIFANLQSRVDMIYEYLKQQGVSVDKIHGGMMQEERLQHLKRFRLSKVRVLVATDVASRGIDVEKIQCVINYDWPTTLEKYVHRIGRSARNHEKGKAITFVTDSQQTKFEELQEYLHKTLSLETCTIHQAPFDLKSLERPIHIREEKGKALRKDIFKIYLNGGKNKKIRPGDIVGAICEIPHVTSDDIGIIQVQDHQTYVDILNNKGKLVLEALQHKTIKGKKLRVQKAK